MAELVYPPVINLARVVFALQGLRFDLRGTEHVPRTGGAVMAINHVGYLDFTYAGLAACPAGRLVRFMAKQEVFEHRVSGPLMRGMHHIPVDREAGAGSYRRAVDALRDGEVVGVFPEATISRSFELKDFKAGRGADGRRGRRAGAADGDLGLPAGVDQGPAEAARAHPGADHGDGRPRRCRWTPAPTRSRSRRTCGR